MDFVILTMRIFHYYGMVLESNKDAQIKEFSCTILHQLLQAYLKFKNPAAILETQLKKGASIKLLEPELYELDDVIQMLLEADTSMPEQLA
mgnify:CR=1 FL=1